MNLVDLSVKRPVTISMIIAILIFLGLISLNRIAIDLFPKIQKPVIEVRTDIPGSGPIEVEQLVTAPIEREVATTEDLQQMTSVSVEGRSEIRLAFGWNANLDAAVMDLRQKIDAIRPRLPAETGKTQISRFDPTADPIMMLDASSAMSPERLRVWAEDRLAPFLDRVPGVAAVQVAGGARRELRVEVDPARLASAGLTFRDVADLLHRENVAQPSGHVEEGRRELLVRTVAEVRTPEQIAALVLSSGSGTRIALGDVATVRETLAERRELARLDGRDSVQIKIFKENDANTLAVVEAVQARLAGTKFARGVTVKTSYDQSTHIRDALALVRANAILGGVLAALVLLLFLRNLRSAMIISVAMPVSIVAAFIPLYFTGISLNIFSLAGLALAVGLVVDNSIVILENIFRHMAAGESARNAALTGTKEVESAVLASTTTTLGVFLPIIFVGGMAGQVFRDLSLSVAYVLVFSELVAITLIPMAASRIFKRSAPLVAARQQGLAGDAAAATDGAAPHAATADGRTAPFFAAIARSAGRVYLGILDAAASSLPRRTTLVAAMGLLFVLTILWLPPLELFPRGAQRDFRVGVQAPPGLALDEADQVLRRIEGSLLASDRVDMVSTSISDEEGTFAGELVIRLKAAEAIPEVSQWLHTLLRAHIPAGHAVEVQPISLLDDILNEGRDPRTYGDLVFQVEGERLDLLEQSTRQVRDVLDRLPMVVETVDTIAQRRPEIQLVLDRRTAADLGVRAVDLADTIQRALSGTVATTIVDNGRHVDLRVVSSLAGELSVRDLGRLPLVRSGDPERRAIALDQVAAVERASGPVEIQHFERRRVLYVTARLAEDRATGEALKHLTTPDGDGAIDRLELPDEIAVRLGGAARTMVESFDQLFFALIIAVALVYMIMAAQFESLIHPFVVMFSVPLSLIGAVVGLHLGGEQLSVTAFIGLIVLVGIAVNDAILLVSTTNLLRSRGLDRWQAITTAGQQRLRPIFMTTLTTVCGMLPLAWGMGPGSEFYEPLALVVIYGLLFATFLTLVMIPTVYIFVDDIGDMLSFVVLRVKMGLVGRGHVRPPGSAEERAEPGVQM